MGLLYKDFLYIHYQSALQRLMVLFIVSLLIVTVILFLILGSFIPLLVLAVVSFFLVLADSFMSRKFFEGLDNQTQIRLVRQLFFSAEGLSISTLERFAKQPSMLLLGWEKDLITEGMEKVYWDDISIVEEIRTVGFNLIRVLYSQGLTAEDPNFFLCKSSDQKFYNLVKKYAPEGNPLRVWVEENEVRR